MSNSGNRQPKRDPWTVEIDVYLTSDADPDHPVFEIDSFLKDEADLLRFHNKGRPGFKVVFHLHDETGCGYHFSGPPRVREAVWSQVGKACPTAPAWEVFEPIKIFNDGMSLVVRNENPSPPQGEFRYTLRVTTGGGKYLALDPGGFNQNGNYR
jgi:hypothetical protein